MLIAVTQVRNERQLLPLCVANLLQQGVDVVLVADHGSTDGTRAWLDDRAKVDLRVQWTGNSDPGFHQADAVTALARVAVAAGAEWVLPVDADEMWVAADSATTLAEVLSAHSDAAALGVETENFPAPHDLDVFRPTDLHRFVRRFVQNGEVPTVMDDIPSFLEGRHSYLPHTPSTKWVVRGHEGIVVGAGGHAVSHGDGTAERTASIRLLHIPLRDRRSLTEKRRHGERLRMSGYDQLHGWQEQMLVGLTSQDEYARFWRANSVGSSGRVPTGAACDEIISDDVLVQVATRLERPLPPPVLPYPVFFREHGLRVMQQTLAEHRRAREDSDRLATEGQRLAVELGKTQREAAAQAAQLRLAAQCLTQATARHARSEARAARLDRELDARSVEVEAMRASRSWRLTEPLRRMTGRGAGATVPRAREEDDSAWAEALVDRAWYLAAYPDVADAGLDPVHHYADSGLDEGRLPRQPLS